MPTQEGLESQIEAIRTVLSQAPPFCSGTSTLEKYGSHLFYLHPTQDASVSSGERAPGFIDLANATDKELKSLMEACQPATFGLKDKDVFDESYRKARKMDTSDFTSRFNPLSCGIVQAVKEQLLNPSEQDKQIRAELYKLNVYNEGSFFRPHVDTPRGNDMFGSLVVIFPTPHKGGKLVLRHQGNQWDIDSNQLLSATAEPSVAFIAFYSDIEHEVEVVSSGYRVTLTYNLYYDNASPDYSMTSTISARAPDEEHIYSTITSLMEDRTKVLPNGGYLGFGLQYKYPISKNTDLSLLLQRLKGADEIVRRVCQRLSYPVSIKLVLSDFVDYVGECDAMIPFAPCLVGKQVYGDLIEIIGGRPVLIRSTEDTRKFPMPSEYEDGVEIVWVMPRKGLTSYQTDYLAYGNEMPSISTFYGDICLVAQVPPLFKVGADESEKEETTKEVITPIELQKTHEKSAVPPRPSAYSLDFFGFMKNLIDSLKPRN